MLGRRGGCSGAISVIRRSQNHREYDRRGQNVGVCLRRAAEPVRAIRLAAFAKTRPTVASTAMSSALSDAPSSCSSRKRASGMGRPRQLMLEHRCPPHSDSRSRRRSTARHQRIVRQCLSLRTSDEEPFSSMDTAGARGDEYASPVPKSPLECHALRRLTRLRSARITTPILHPECRLIPRKCRLWTPWPRLVRPSPPA